MILTKPPSLFVADMLQLVDSVLDESELPIDSQVRIVLISFDPSFNHLRVATGHHLLWLGPHTLAHTCYSQRRAGTLIHLVALFMQYGHIVIFLQSFSAKKNWIDSHSDLIWSIRSSDFERIKTNLSYLASKLISLSRTQRTILMTRNKFNWSNLIFAAPQPTVINRIENDRIEQIYSTRLAPHLAHSFEYI